MAVSEVSPIQNATHHLNLPPDTKLPWKVHQQPLFGDKQNYFFSHIDIMLKAGIITPIAHEDVKFCGNTVLAQKAHTTKGLSHDELKLLINDECTKHGFPHKFDLPERTSTPAQAASPPQQTKWRICQSFKALNDITTVPPMPQGDIRAKQQALAGHRWITIFDFASGFYACLIAKEDQPYICFYVAGRGYFKYLRMPFGLTGAPSHFADMTATALGDLVGILCQLFIDDGGVAGDVFADKMKALRTLLLRIRTTGLSLSAAKTQFFMTTAKFAGETIRPNGISTDPSKISAIVNWKTPTTMKGLSRFVHLGNYYRSVCTDYGRIARPLTDLVRDASVPTGNGKFAHQKALRDYSLEGQWTRDHQKAFLDIKAALTSAPILRSPIFDGRPFTITTDGCKHGFAGILSQHHKTKLPDGKTVTRRHPIAFASKRTSCSEEKYKPFLSEFAALKFSLDKFSDMVWGSPIELETDCQALRDFLLNDSLNIHHARWRDGILAHDIRTVRHRPGTGNPADGPSRMFDSGARSDNDGGEWTVGEDWEASSGLIHDLFLTSIPPKLSSSTTASPRNHYFAR
ncbi:hypothetical protein EW146_g9125 [Bondarzewia mesenterica]|uniref:Reverse transcriptase domain-containing protein n=1 Tax=Bondarzewia mesenterica TaxID=1095465 RepID=A0A4S4LAC6_9AGAM|nr:hypothetical protein EW146_g9125 [Bondarzewia mesenterica]